MLAFIVIYLPDWITIVLRSVPSGKGPFLTGLYSLGRWGCVLLIAMAVQDVHADEVGLGDLGSLASRAILMIIFLFGSYAWGVPCTESDLDTYVVLPENADMREIDAVKLIRKAIHDKKTMPVDVIVSKENESNRWKIAPTIER